MDENDYQTTGLKTTRLFSEEKNSTLVRAFLGDLRLDTVRQTRFLNHIYGQMNLYHNYIQPVMHQVAKEWISNSKGSGGYTRCKHDDALPPVVRLCATACLSDAERAALLAQRHTLNPLALRRKIYADL